MDNTKNYALITGATSGIGLELAKIFASEGYNLVLVARTEADLDLVAAGLAGYNVDVTTIAKDLFNPKAASEIYNEVNEKTLKVTVLVNNAGQGEYGLFENT
ncbi:MAG: SDR family NAD(P)-dependent oxidoreductase, partial [Chitinophagaceae bacterium]